MKNRLREKYSICRCTHDKSFDDMVTTSLNRAREHGTETESPLEILFKL